MASFHLPHIQEVADIWGPPSTTSAKNNVSTSVLPEEFRDIPFTPYAKSDKIGRFADWNATPNSLPAQQDAFTRSEDRSALDANGNPLRGGAAGIRSAQTGAQSGRRNDGLQTLGAGASSFAYFHGNDDASFSVVDNARSAGAKRGGLSQMNRSARPNQRGGPAPRTNVASANRPNPAPQRSNVRTVPQRAAVPANRGGRRGGWRDWDRPQRTRDPSVVVGPDWEQIEEIDFSRLAKLRLDVGEAEDISSYGTLFEYDRSYDRIASVRFEKALQPLDRVRYNPTTSDDPVIQKLAEQPINAPSEGTTSPSTRILITDSILALLMSTTRSVYPWDIVITRDTKGNVFFDKRDGGAFDFVTVNENALDPPAELEGKEGEAPKDKALLLNTPSSLSLEATYINQNFAFQVVNEKKQHQLDDGPNPFVDENTEKEQMASWGLRYRKFDLSTPERDTELVVRTEIDAIVPAVAKGQSKQYITIKTLNEFDSRAQGSGGAPDWRSKLDSQRGAIVATEMKNNGAKLARFAVQSLLAGADNMKMGYISRANARDASRHVILGTQWYKPRDLAMQINVNLANGWGIVRTIADLVTKDNNSEPAKFVLTKDPNKATIRLYKVPNNWPSDEDDTGLAEGMANLATSTTA